MAVDVDDVRDDLEGVKGNADRKRQPGHRKRKPQQRIDRLDRQTAVFEDAKKAEIDEKDYCQCKTGLRCAAQQFDHPAVEVIKSN